MRLLEAGCTVARTADDLPRYHGKFILIDDALVVTGFNFTRLDVEKSRSFGLATRDPRLVREARALFEADRTRQPYSASHDRLVVSPENAREVLTAAIRRTRKQLLIYDSRITDTLIHRVLADRARAGLDIRVLGSGDRLPPGIACRELKGLRLHVRAFVSDGASAFIGSQSLRRVELDARREVGLLTTDRRIARRLIEVFEGDWTAAGNKQKDRDREPEKSAKAAPRMAAAAAG
jgi:phosphatidylserine/phosphatidylglycerophosphate/cardiolipin synthase-like enzyme